MRSYPDPRMTTEPMFYGSPMPMGFQMPPETQLHLVPNDEHHRLEVHLRGPIGDPESIAEQLTCLYQYAEAYSVCVIFINSPGGSIATLVELLSVMKKFDTVITVATGEIASAGFMLWCSGDIRVVQEYCSVMCHRESFGNAGKTDSHIDLAQYTSTVYGQMVRDICGDILTDEEMERIRYTEVYLTSEELLTRQTAITWDQFIQADLEEVETHVTTTVVIDGETYQFVSDDHVMRVVESEEGRVGVISPYLQVLYGVPKPAEQIVEIED